MNFSIGAHISRLVCTYVDNNIYFQITDPTEAVGELGDLEHMRGLLDQGNLLKAGELCWMTDRTPHESMSLKKGTRRQYFRLVTSQVSAWYEDHSTPNPLGVVPPGSVTILKGNKFRKEDGKTEETKEEAEEEMKE